MTTKIEKVKILIALKDIRLLLIDNAKRKSELHDSWSSDHPAVKELNDEREDLYKLELDLKYELEKGE